MHSVLLPYAANTERYVTGELRRSFPFDSLPIDSSYAIHLP
jgi:hypothetical protein